MLLEEEVFSKEYRLMVRDLKKLARADYRDEEKLDDIRASEGAGRKGPTDLSGGISQSGYVRRSPRKKSRPANNEEKKDSDTRAASPADAEV